MFKPAPIAEEARPQRAAIVILRREHRADVLADAEEVLRAVGGPAARATDERQPDERRQHTVSPRQHRSLHRNGPAQPMPEPNLWARRSLSQENARNMEC